MPKSKKPEWLKRKIAEAYRRRADRKAPALNPEQRELIMSAEQEAEQRSADGLAERFRNERTIKRWHVPQWNQNGTMTAHVVQESSRRDVYCHTCGIHICNDGALGRGSGNAVACQHIEQVIVGGRLPFVEDHVKPDGITVYRCPELWLNQRTAQINNSLREATERRQNQERDQLNSLILRYNQLFEQIPRDSQAYRDLEQGRAVQEAQANIEQWTIGQRIQVMREMCGRAEAAVPPRPNPAFERERANLDAIREAVLAAEARSSSPLVTRERDLLRQYQAIEQQYRERLAERALEQMRTRPAPPIYLDRAGNNPLHLTPGQQRLIDDMEQFQKKPKKLPPKPNPVLKPEANKVTTKRKFKLPEE